MKAKANFSVKKWDEQTSEQISANVKITKATVEYEFKADLDGTGYSQNLMYYTHFDGNDQHNSEATYLGFIRFAGKLNGKEGSFVMEENGTYKNGSANSKLKIVNDSGDGALKNISGSGFYIAQKNGIEFELDYNL